MAAMPSWHEILTEIQTSGSTHDIVRRRFLKRLREKTGRNVILYYSGWLQKPNVPGMEVNDSDKNGFMTVIHGLKRDLGLDLILHTPGGSAAATESIVDYLRQIFGTNIRAVVPQLAMSAGTMIACAARSILMGKQSSLGPVDPQFAGIPAHGVVEEFRRAYDEIRRDQAKIPVWQPIIAKYHPTLVGECEKAIKWADEMVKEWLVSGMLAGDPDPAKRAASIIKDLGDHSLTMSHERHLSAQRCREMGLKVEMMEEDDDLQDAVLSVHHACVHTLTSTAAVKIIENHEGVAFIRTMQTMVVKAP
jgi:hypothetical protein